MSWIKERWSHRPAFVGYVVMSLFIAVGFYGLGNQISKNERLIETNRRMLSEQIRKKPLYTIVQPVQVANRVPDVRGPAIRTSSATISADYDLCNTDRDPIAVQSTISYTSLDANDRVTGSLPRLPVTNNFSIEPGCHAGRFDSPLQASLPVGRWRQVSLIVASQPRGPRSDTHIVLSEIFKVVP